jgi:RNA-directed DNA polymerase
MTVEIGSINPETFNTGAPIDLPEDWSQIHWPPIKEQVKRMQMRIAKAVREERWGKVKALQHLLTRSFYGKLLAVKRVTENKGKRTAGVDGKIWSTSASKKKSVMQIRHRGYKPLPLRRLYIPKSDGKKKRGLGIPSMSDRAMQALWMQALQPVAETVADQHSYGFRPYRSAADAIEQCFNVLATRSSSQWVLEADIRSCFDEISHDWLLRNIPMDKGVLQSWLQAGYIEKGTLHETIAGTPQGGIASPTIACMTLDGLEVAVYRSVGSKERDRRKFKINVIRYADDFVITGCTKEVLEQYVKPAVARFLAERGLNLSEEKTRIVHVTQGFDFLGQNVRKYGNKLLIKPSRKSIKVLMDKVRGIVKANKSIEQAVLIRQLNPVIRGWANYHRHVVSSQVFNLVDNQIWLLLWRWAKRRHPNKNAVWIRKRYFHRIGNYKWVFAQGFGSHVLFVGVKIYRAASVPIKRHIKIRSYANPYDAKDADYFVQRQR